MQQSVLVTGANGFVGSHVLEALGQREDLRVIAACRDAGKLSGNFSGEVRVGDLRDQSYRQSLVAGVDVLCHAAAWTSMWGQRENSQHQFLEPGLELIKAARAAGVKRFVNTSTTSAAAPRHSSNPMSPGISRAFWPHLSNVIALENELRTLAGPDFQVVNLRLGVFAGRRYGLGLLPILVPRLKTHLVPWVDGGRTSLPIIDGRDIGQAFALAATASSLADYEAFNIVGPEVPNVRQVVTLLHDEFGLPKPHFGVPFAIAYPFAFLMEKIDSLVPWDPLVTRSIIHLMEEVGVDNTKAERLLGYRPEHDWREAVRAQMAEMAVRQTAPMAMVRPVI